MCPDLPACNQSAGKCLAKSAAELAPFLRPLCHQIGDCVKRGHDTITFSLLDVARVKVCLMKNKHARHWRIAPESRRYGHVKLGRHYVGQLIQAERGLMGIHPYGTVVAAPGPQRPENELVLIRSWKPRQPIDTPTLTNPLAGANVVWVMRRNISTSASLFRCEIPTLRFRYPV